MYRIEDIDRQGIMTWQYDTKEDTDAAWESLIREHRPGHRLIMYDEGTPIAYHPPRPSEGTYNADLRTNGSTRGLKVHVPADIVDRMDLKLGDRVQIVIRRLE